MNCKRAIKILRGNKLAAQWCAAILASVFYVATLHAADGESEPDDELIQNTERQAKAVAQTMYEYRLKEVEIEDKGIDLNDGTMLGGKYQYDLKQINTRFEAAFSQLQARVASLTGTSDDARRKAALIATHWHRELYGFGTEEELDEQIASRRSVAWLAVALTCLVIGWIPKRITKPEADSTPVEVPAELTRIVVPGQQYQVNLLTGLVMDKELWDEVKTTTVYYQNGSFGFGNHPAEVRTETTRKGKTFLLNHTGREEVLNLTGYGHDYRPGNIVTFVFQGRGKKRSAVIAYNHATEKTEEMIGLDEAHATHWKINFAVTCGLAYYCFNWAAEPMRNLGANNAAWVWVQALGAALVFTAVIHSLVVWLRNRRFRNRYQPRFESFLRNGTETIRETFQKLISVQQGGSISQP